MTAAFNWWLTNSSARLNVTQVSLPEARIDLPGYRELSWWTKPDLERLSVHQSIKAINSCQPSLLTTLNHY